MLVIESFFFLISKFSILTYRNNFYNLLSKNSNSVIYTYPALPQFYYGNIKRFESTWLEQYQKNNIAATKESICRPLTSIFYERI